MRGLKWLPLLFLLIGVVFLGAESVQAQQNHYDTSVTTCNSVNNSARVYYSGSCQGFTGYGYIAGRWTGVNKLVGYAVTWFRVYPPNSPGLYCSLAPGQSTSVVDGIVTQVDPGTNGGYAPCPNQIAGSSGFVSASGTHLMLGGATYRFDGLNMYDLNSRSTCGTTYTNADLDTSMSDQAGGEAIRAWFFQELATKNGARDWSAFDNSLSVAANHGKKVIVTLQNQWRDCVSSGYKTLGWYQGGYKTRQGTELTSYRQWVSDVVSRYKDNPTVLMFQLVNEPEDSNSQGGSCSEANATSALRSFTDDVGGLIHSLDPNHLVNLGALGSGQCGMQGSDYQTVNASPGNDLCEYHDYGSPAKPMPGDQYNGLQVRLNQCATLNKPLFVGETGIQTSSTLSQQQRATDFDNKFSAQFSAGVVGELVWAWELHPGSLGYDVGPGDPTLRLLTKY